MTEASHGQLASVVREHAGQLSELLLRKPLEILNKTLSGREHLVGGNFTVADLNVASILVWGKMGRLDLSAHPDVARWLDSCLARPAYSRVRDRTRHK